MHLGHAAPVRDARVACTDRLLSREHQRIVVFVLRLPPAVTSESPSPIRSLLPPFPSGEVRLSGDESESSKAGGRRRTSVGCGAPCSLSEGCRRSELARGLLDAASSNRRAEPFRLLPELESATRIGG
jgi:hypothetical protein